MPNPLAWVFVVGCYNSGTTLLAELLKLSGSARALPWEGVSLTHHLKSCTDFGYPRMWWKVEDRVLNAEAKLSAREAEQIKRQWAFSASSRDGQSFFVEKSITNALRFPFLAENFNPALFLHIVRDPVAVCEGIRRKARPADESLPPYSLRDCSQMWMRSNAMLTQQLEDRNHRLIRYEDLCSDPAREIMRIQEFLRQFNPSIPPLGINIPPDGPKVHGRNMKIIDQNYLSYGRVSSEEIAEIRQGLGELRSRFGYVEDAGGASI